MIAESFNMSVGSVFTIMTEDLKKKKLCARFVPHTLTTEQKEHRIASSENLIAAADEDPNFLKTIVTGDESWCLEYDPETKRQSSEWTSPGKGRPMKVRASKSKTKTMLLVFFDSRGIIHHEFLRQGSTVTGADLAKYAVRSFHPCSQKAAHTCKNDAGGQAVTMPHYNTEVITEAILPPSR
ncbi:histone-lysine N-methyltransferase SETMAR [Nephila pilipes]|uniref:Histone-lysine N-methyltransferase SETMAR n=1 Tax=Nephila pilipes TaxID=299642 RepID=A0A8X6NSI3_NEPPI|nr:histone-lysine N-methyltransferase SETMAR [Nephila pilipes]